MHPSSPSITFRQVFRKRQFFLLWLAQFVSNFGDWVAVLALFSLVAFRWQGSAYQVSGIFIAFALPWAVLAPVAGVFVDRWSLKRTMIASDLIRAALALLLAFATNVYQLYALMFTLSAVSCFFLPAQTALIPRLVAKEELLVANSINAQTLQFSKTVGPAVAGLLIVWVSEKLCFYLDALSFLFSAVLLSLLPSSPGMGASRRGLRAMLEELHVGFEFLWTHRPLRFVTLAMVAVMLAVGNFDALIAVYVRDVLRAASPVLGGLVASVGLGTILGAFAIGRLGQRWPRVPLVFLGIFGAGIGIFLFAVSGRVPLALTYSLYLGLTASAVFVPAQTLMQEVTPPEVLGRVSSTSWALLTVAQLAAVSIAGKLADWFGIRNLFALVALLLVLIGLVGYSQARSLRSTSGMARKETPA